jgi:hypothetical protein
MNKKQYNLYIFRPLVNKETEYINSLTNANIYVIKDLKTNLKKEIEIIKFDKDLDSIWKEKILEFTTLSVQNKDILDFFSFNNSKTNIWFYHKFKLYFNKLNTYAEILILNKREKEIHTIVYSANLKKDWFNSEPNIEIKNELQKKNNKSNITFTNIVKLTKFTIITIWRILISNKKNNFITNPYFLNNYITNYNNTEYNNQTVLDNKIWAYFHQKFQNKLTVIEEGQFMSLKKINSFSKYNFQKISTNTVTFEYLFFLFLLKPKHYKLVKTEVNDLQQNISSLYLLLRKPEERMIVDMYLNERNANILYLSKFYTYVNFFSKARNIKAVLSYSENTSTGKIILDAARNEKITTLGVQHGTISKKNIAYNFSKQEHKHNAIADYILIWGNNALNNLIKYGNYKNENCYITGQIRTDSLHYYKENKNPDINTICFFSQPQPDQDERYLAAESIILATKKYQNLNLLIKLHPAESDNLYLDLIEKHHAKNITIIKKEKSLYEVLASVSVAITCYSTVGLEALLFDIPLIVFDSKTIDKSQYIKNKIAYHCKNTEDLIIYLEKISTNNLKIKEGSEKFIHKSFYKIDGKVSDRTIDFLNKIDQIE